MSIGTSSKSLVRHKFLKDRGRRVAICYSLNDIDKVLKLQPRHFGAIAGSGLIYIKKKKYDKALNFYKKLDRIDPMNQESKMFIKLINKILLENSA